MGQAPSGRDCNRLGTGTPFVKVGEFGERRPIVREWTTKPLRMARRSDVLLCVVGATCGKINLGEDCAIGRSVAALRPHPSQIDQFYLYYFMQTLVDRLRAGSLGAAQTVISKNMVESVQIPLPPLPEQRRIVAMLDEAFARIATAKSNANKNLQNARAIFECSLNNVFRRGRDRWTSKTLGDVADFKNGLNFTRQSKGQTLKIVGVGDFKNRSVVPTQTLQSATIDGAIGTDYLIRAGDILTVRSNGSKDLVGRCMLVREVTEPTSFSGFVIRLRVDARQMKPELLLHLLRASDTRDRLTSVGGGANISNINQAKLASLPIVVPPLNEQHSIAVALDELRMQCDGLVAVYERKLAALEALKKSLLHSAFAGESTTTKTTKMVEAVA